MNEHPSIGENIKIDHCHADLICGLVKSAKPNNILELGFGGGRSCVAILNGATYNGNCPQYTLVDNWLDFNRQQPSGLPESNGTIKVQIITSDESNYVTNCNEKYDFIMSDADHQHTNEWFQDVYNRLLSGNGILIYHDISLYYTNLVEILNYCVSNQISHMLFNNSTLPGEHCERGLLVIFKNDAAPKMPRCS
jgi:predicted O-methyltransferase YrrM